MGLCGPEDVVDGSSGKHLPHGFIDDLLVIATSHSHWAQEAHDKHLLQEGVCHGNEQTSAARQQREHEGTRGRVNERLTNMKNSAWQRQRGPLSYI